MEANSSAANAGMQCSVSIPRTRLRGISATVRQLGRLGASVWLRKQDLQGNALVRGESFELDIPLPENETFPPRTLNAFGSVIRTGDGMQGRQWVVIRFHSLQFRGAERLGENSAGG